MRDPIKDQLYAQLLIKIRVIHGTQRHWSYYDHLLSEDGRLYMAHTEAHSRSDPDTLPPIPKEWEGLSEAEVCIKLNNVWDDISRIEEEEGR